MDLPKSIVKEFAKQAVEKKPTVDKPTQLVGTVQVEDGQTFVYLDGSNGSKTPVSETVAYQSGDRVLVSIQNRKATIIGNYTGPSINQALDNVIVEYALSSSSVSFIAWPGEKGEWNTIAPEKEDGSYMWQRTTKISTNPLVNPEISLTCIQGSDGEDGRGISSTVISYAKSNDGNTAPTSGWENRIPPLTDSEPYLWTKTHIVYTSDSPAYTDIYTVSKKGETGAIGTGISSITEEWARGTDSTADSSSWGTSQPTLTTTYPVLWYRLKIEWINPSSTTYAPSSKGQKSTMINELVAFRNLIANDGYTTINGSKIGSGTITLGGTANGDGLLEVYDSLNELVAKLSKDENIFAGFKVKAGYGILGFGDTGDLQRSYFSLQHEFVGWDYYFEDVPSIQFAQHTFDNEKFFDSIDGWYQSNNKGYANTAAMEEIELSISSPTHVYMDVVDCSNDTVNDYGTVSIIGGTLDETSTYSSVGGNVKWTGYNNHKVGGETIDFGIVQPGVHHIMLRYKKGNSSAYENDRLYFRLYTGKEPALFYEDDAGSLMYISKTRLYQRRIEATYDDPHNPESVSYSCYKTLIRNASMDVEMSDSDYVPINEPEIPLQRRISKTNIGGGFIDFTFNNGSTRLRYEDVEHTLYTDANISTDGNLIVQGDNLVSKIQAMLCTAYTETLTVTDGTFTNAGCSAVLVGNTFRLYLYGKAKSAISAGNISNQTMLTITFTDSKISAIYSISGTGAASGPNSQMYFKCLSSGSQHTITVTLAAIAQNIAKGGEINSFVAIPCVLNWDAY